MVVLVTQVVCEGEGERREKGEWYLTWALTLSYQLGSGPGRFLGWSVDWVCVWVYFGFGVNNKKGPFGIKVTQGPIL